MGMRKVSVSAVAGALTIISVYAFKIWKPQIEISNEVAQAFTLLVSSLLVYIVPEGDQA